MATEHDKVAFNLTGSFIDIFQDDSGIATETTVDRNASEYVSSNMVTGAYVTGDRSSSITVTSTISSAGGSYPNLVNGQKSQTGAAAFYWNNHTPSSGSYIQFALSTAKRFTEAKWIQDALTTHGTWKWQGSNTAGGASGYVDIGSTFTLGGGGALPAWNTITTLTELSGNTTSYLYYRLVIQSGAVSIGSWNTEIEFKETSGTTNATGTLISNAQTVASTSEVSGVFTYTDSSGVNTIGTDLAIYFTANNGTNWTEASSYGTATTFSGSVKQVKLGKTTVTAGTQVALKAVWANQVAAASGTSGLLDQSGTSKTVTNNGVTQSTTQKKWGTHSLYFNGSSNFSVAAHTDFDFAAADATIEFWYYTTSGGNNRVIGRGSHPGEWFYRSRFAEAGEDFKSYINGSNQSSSASARYNTLNTWTHGAIVRDGSNIRVYTGGVQRWSTAVSGSWTVTSTGNAIGIGRGLDAGTGEWFTGYLQDIRISNTARYPSGTTFTPPAAAFVTDSNTKLLINGNDAVGVAGKVAYLEGWAVNY